jgi:hypothetical protein
MVQSSTSISAQSMVQTSAPQERQQRHLSSLSLPSLRLGSRDFSCCSACSRSAEDEPPPPACGADLASGLDSAAGIGAMAPPRTFGVLGVSVALGVTLGEDG